MMPVVVRAQDSELGVVTTLQGTAVLVRAAGPSGPLGPNDHLFSGDRIVTHDGSLVRVLLGRRAVVTLSPGSSLTLGGTNGSQVLVLLSGTVYYHVRGEGMPPGAVHEVRAPNVVTRLTGTVVSVEIENVSEPVTRVCVAAGAASAITRSGAVVVSANQCVLVTGDRMTRVPLRRHPAPPPREAPPERTIGLR